MNDGKSIYTTDIEMVMDFMKLALFFDKTNNSNFKDNQNKKMILKLESSLLELLPVAQNNRMASIYKILTLIHNKQQILIKPNINKKSQFIILFFSSSCPASQKILNDWKQFKNQPHESFTVIDYDGDDFSNDEIFKHFNITDVPTVIKLNLTDTINVEKLDVPITLESVDNFSRSFQ